MTQAHQFQNKLVSLLLIMISIASIALMLHHPVHHEHTLAAQVTELSAMAILSAWVHGILIVMIIVYSLCFRYLCDSVLVSETSKIASYLLQIGNIFMIGAALISGFIYPSIAYNFADASNEQLQVFEALQSMAYSANQALAKAAVFAWMAAITGWCLHMLYSHANHKWIFAVFLIISIGLSVSLALQIFTLNLFGMTLVAGVFSLWCIVLGLYIHPHFSKFRF